MRSSQHKGDIMSKLVQRGVAAVIAAAIIAVVTRAYRAARPQSSTEG